MAAKGKQGQHRIVRRPDGTILTNLSPGAGQHPSWISKFGNAPVEFDVDEVTLDAEEEAIRLGGDSSVPRETLTNFGEKEESNVSPTLNSIVTKGNDTNSSGVRLNNKISCKDGFSVSVIVGESTYCSPRPGTGGTPSSYNGPYDLVEVGFPSETPKPWESSSRGEGWSGYAEDHGSPTETVYGYVPISMVYSLIESHGGEL